MAGNNFPMLARLYRCGGGIGQWFGLKKKRKDLPAACPDIPLNGDPLPAGPEAVVYRGPNIPRTRDAGCGVGEADETAGPRAASARDIGDGRMPGGSAQPQPRAASARDVGDQSTPSHKGRPRPRAACTRDVGDGVRAADETVGPENEQNILCGGTAEYITVISGGYQKVHSGGSALFTTLGSGGRQTVFGGGTADNTSVDAEGYLLVDPGGTAGAVYIGPGGVQDVYGSDSYSFIGSGGRQYIHGSGVVSASIIGMGGTQHVSSGGTSLHVTIGIDGRQFIYDNGTADSTVVGYGGEQIIEAGGASEFTTVSSGGRQEVCSGGKAHSTIVAAGGCQYVSRGGAAYSTAVAAGGRQEITAGGAADRTVVALGGQQSIYYGGKASHTTVASGGCQHIGVKGTAFAATVNQGGKLDIACGGILAGSTHIADGGILRIAGHAVFQDSATVLRIECNGGASLNEPLTGAGSLVKDGTGTLTFNAANDFIGSLIIDGGTAALGPAGSLKSRSLHLRGNTTFDHSAAAGPFPVRSLAVTGLNATIRPGDSATDLTGADIVCAVPPEARSGDIFLFINGNAVTDASTRFAITYSAGRPAVGAGDYFVLLAAAGTLDTGGFTRQDVRTQCGDTFSVEPDPGDSGRLIAVLSAPA